MEKQPPTDYKAPQATGARVDNPSGDGLDRDRAYDSGFKYQIPEAHGAQGAGYNNESTGPGYQQSASFGDDSKRSAFPCRGILSFPIADETEPTNTTQSQGGNMGERVGSGVRGVFAGIHVSDRRGRSTFADGANSRRALASGCAGASTRQLIGRSEARRG
jgi:hypothetical protein